MTTPKFPPQQRRVPPPREGHSMSLSEKGGGAAKARTAHTLSAQTGRKGALPPVRKSHTLAVSQGRCEDSVRRPVQTGQMKLSIGTPLAAQDNGRRADVRQRFRRR
jgi:hypothetical protein